MFWMTKISVIFLFPSGKISLETATTPCKQNVRNAVNIEMNWEEIAIPLKLFKNTFL